MKKLFIVQFAIDLHQAEDYRPNRHRAAIPVVAIDADEALSSAEQTIRGLIPPTYSYHYVQTYEPER
jgi:hypothetical protein